MNYNLLNRRIIELQDRLDELKELNKKMKAAGPRDLVDLEVPVRKKITEIKRAAEDLAEGVVRGSE